MFAPKIIALCALLSVSTAYTLDDTQWNVRVPHYALGKRQDSSDEDQKLGSNCTEAFGAGYETCRVASDTELRLCYNPSAGQICCQNEWGCPSNSFCLIKDVCCPTGVSPSECASVQSVSLPATYTTAGTGPAPTSSDSTTIVSTIVTSTPVSTISVPSTNSSQAGPAGATSTASIVPVPYPAGNVSASNGYIASSGMGTGYLASATGKGFASATASGGRAVMTSATLFEGAGSRTFEVGGLFAGALGVAFAIAGLA